MKNWLCIMGLAGFICACSSRPEKPLETKRETSGMNVDHSEGKKLFYSKCASCHMVNKELTGPALKGVEERWPDKEKLYAFVRNSDSVINADKYARELWLRYNQTAMPPHADLTDADITTILDYINSVSEAK